MKEIVIKIKLRPEAPVNHDKQIRITHNWLVWKLKNDLLGTKNFEIESQLKG
jgi:hypothetical protein